jgi:hypothetical protein
VGRTGGEGVRVSKKGINSNINYISHRASPRQVGTPGKLIIWHPFRPISLNFTIWLAKISKRSQNGSSFSEKFFHTWKIWVYQHYIFNYSSDILSVAAWLAYPLDWPWCHAKFVFPEVVTIYVYS